MVAEICNRRGLKCEIKMTETIDACPMNARMCERLAKAARSRDEQSSRRPSAARCTTAPSSPRMSRRRCFSFRAAMASATIQRSSAEWRTSPLRRRSSSRLVRRPTVAQLNALDQKRVRVAVCGGSFEHSPWIAERAWKNRPFASIGDLHEKLTNVVSQSTTEEKLSLVRAHPDLVGKLARDGKLTRESSAEQAAAGLAKLSADEIAAFERYNARISREIRISRL